MAIVSSIVAEDGPEQGNTGQKYMRFEFTDHTGKVHTHHGYRKYPIATDADTQRLVLIPELEASLTDSELDEAFHYGVNGGDIDVFPWQWHTTAEIQTYFWRRFMNLFRDESTDELAGEKIAISITAAPYYNKNGNPVIKDFINDPNWANNTVGGALTKIAAVAVNAVQLDHGEAELAL